MNKCKCKTRIDSVVVVAGLECCHQWCYKPTAEDLKFQKTNFNGFDTGMYEAAIITSPTDSSTRFVFHIFFKSQIFISNDNFLKNNVFSVVIGDPPCHPNEHQPLRIQIKIKTMLEEILCQI